MLDILRCGFQMVQCGATTVSETLLRIAPSADIRPQWEKTRDGGQGMRDAGHVTRWRYRRANDSATRRPEAKRRLDLSYLVSRPQ